MVGLRVVGVVAALCGCGADEVSVARQDVVVGDELAVAASGRTPAVASNGSTFLVAWETGGAIRAVRFDGTGTALDAQPLAIGSGAQPAVASNGTDYLVTFSTSGSIFANRVTGAGVVVDGTGFSIQSGSANDAPHVASDGTDYVIVWETYIGDSHYDIYGAPVSGGSVGSPFAVSTAHWAETPAVGALAGTYLVTWSEYAGDHTQADLFGAVYASGSLGGARTLVVNSHYQGMPAVATNGTSYLVAFSDTRNEGAGYQYDLYGTHVAADGSPLELDGFAISSGLGHQYHASLASNGFDYFVAWDDERNATPDVYGDLVHDSTTSVANGVASNAVANEAVTSIGYNASAHAYLIAFTSASVNAPAATAVKARLIRECGDGVLQAGETCDDGNLTNGDGCSAACAIEAGYTCSGAGPGTCADIDECATANGGCNQLCTNSAGSYACSCEQGYALGGDFHTCADIDECATANGGCNELCTNTEGSYACSCVNPNEGLDEETHHICAPCNTGYQIVGGVCADIDECATANGGCAETCTNSPGTFACACTGVHEVLAADGKTCTCAAGYALTGGSCEDVDECAAGSDTCSGDETCRNTEGSFACDPGGGCTTSSPSTGALLVTVLAMAGRWSRRRRRPTTA